jgi:hypothetical protein
MGYEVFVYLFCVAFLTLCASRYPRDRLPKAGPFDPGLGSTWETRNSL